VRTWRLGVVVVVVLATTWWLRADVIDSVGVSSGSMAPTVCRGDRLLILRAGASDAERGELVTFHDPVDDEPTLKRVVAVEGQVVQIKDGLLYVDGQQVLEEYVDQASIDGTYYRQVIVGKGLVFVLGDERERSVDSRDYGPISRSSIDGRVLTRLWSGCPD
jgi:signal peptidase I